MSKFWLTGDPSDALQNGVSLGAGPDFFNLMSDPAEWAAVHFNTSVLQIYEDFVQSVPIKQQQSFYAWAAQNNIALSFNSGVTTLDDPDVAQYIAQFVSLGGTVAYLTMDEPLYIECEDPNYAQLDVDQLAQNVADSIAQIKKSAPNALIVDQEPIPVTPPSELSAWCRAYQAAVGTPLDGMQLDVDWNYPTATWEPALISAVATLELCGVPPGIIIDGYASTDMGWCDEAINNYETCRALFGDTIAVYDFQTWMPNPTNLLSDTNPASLTNVEYAAQFYDQISAAYQSILGRVPTQGELFAAMRALSSQILNLSQLQSNLRQLGEGVPASALYDGASGTATFLPGTIAAVALTSNDQTVVAGSRLTVITCPIADVADDIIGYSPAATMVEMTGPGTVYPGAVNTYLSPPGIFQFGDLTDNLTLVLSSQETITVGPSLDIAVVAGGENDTISMTWQGAPAGTIATGNTTTMLDLTCSGTVEPGGAIFGIGTLALSQAVPGSPFKFNANTNSDVKIVDTSGGDTIAVADATQTVVNQGTVATTVQASAAVAGATVNGEVGGATLEVTSAGTFTLGAGDTNLTVKVPSFSSATLNAMPFITADATAGDASITVGAGGQTILAGIADVVTDPAKLGYTLLGSHAQLTGDIIVGFNAADIIDITDFSAPYAFSSDTLVGQSSFVSLDQGMSSLVLDLVGVTDVGQIHLTGDGHGGSFVEY